MEIFYSQETNVLNLVALLKAHHIRKVVASPGITDVNFIVSMQNDPFFEMYSCIDERSAAFMACGIAAESREPVVITCTESTASRNYYPALTEAYHRKLPILAVTGLHDYRLIGNLEPQVIDRSESPKDTFRLKVHLPLVNDERSAKHSEYLINKAILELCHHGGGPVHINLPSLLNMTFTQKELPKVRVINRYMLDNEFPNIDGKKIAVFCGVHAIWSDDLVNAVERFCSAYNSVVFGCAACGYNGKYKILSTKAGLSQFINAMNSDVELLVHIGQESGDYNIRKFFPNVKEVWRVDEDGELRDYFGKLTKVFEMSDSAFFKYYSTIGTANQDEYLNRCLDCVNKTDVKESYPFSNIYAASKIAPLLPANSVLHLGLSNTLRAWMLFSTPKSVYTYSNLGTRGIDGGVSTMVGASQVNKDKLYFGVFGDLSLMYDLTAIGNRHVGNNIRIILINNDGGCLFRSWGHKVLGREFLNQYIAASGHMLGKSNVVIRHLCEDLGFEYLSAHDKESFNLSYKRFITPEITEKPMLFELFTNPEEEMEAFSISNGIAEADWKKNVKTALGDKGVSYVRKLLNKQ